MPSQSVSQKFYYSALYLTAFAIPFPFIFASLAIVFLSLAWVLNFNVQKTITLLKERKIIWIWTALYAIQALSCFYSIDKHIALQDLQTKMSFILLPLIIGAGLPLDSQKIEKIFSAFISGLFLMASFFLARAFCLWAQTTDAKVFFYHDLIYGVGANAVYYSLYVFLGLTILLIFPWAGSFLAQKRIYYTILAVLLGFLILLSSKLMILLFGILVLPVYIIKEIKARKRLGYASIAIGILILGIVLFTNNPISKRYHDILENTDKKEWLPEYAQGQKQHFTNLTLRLFLWKTAIQNVRDNNLWWWGCGAGSIETLQKQKISAYGAKDQLLLDADPPLWKYNLHNMYLQELMMLGLPGLLLFLFILIFPFSLLKYIENKTIYLLFNLSIVLFMFQESALQTQAGVVFYLFFFSVFYSYVIFKKSNRTEVLVPSAKIENSVKVKLTPSLWIATVVAVAYWQIAFLRHILLWDSLNFSYPLRFYVCECLRNGHLPLWLPYQSTGYPIYADPQSGCWYPITWIFSAFGRYTLASSNLEYVISIFIGGYGMFYLAKDWVKDKQAALLVAACYACCGLFVSNAEHMTWVVSAAWLPWLFWSYYQMLVRLEAKFAAFIAIIVYLIASGGYPAFLIISFYLFVVLFVTVLFIPEFRKNWKKLFALHCILLFLSLGCCSVLFYSFVQGLHSCTRSGGVSLQDALFYPFSSVCFPSFLLPLSSVKSFDLYKIDITMANGYFGVVGFILLVMSFLQKKDKRYWLILALSLLCMAAATGDALPVRAFLYNWVPLMNVFRFPSIFRIFFIIAFLLLGAGAFSNLKNDFAKWRKYLLAVILALLVFYLITLIHASLLLKAADKPWYRYILDLQNIKKASYAQIVVIQSLFQIFILSALVVAVLVKMKKKLNFKIIFAICVADLVLSTQLNMFATIAYPNLLAVTQRNIDQCPKGFPIPDNNAPLGNYYDSKYWWQLDPIAGNTLVFKKMLGIDGYNPFMLQSFAQFEKSKLKDSAWKNPPAYFANKINRLSSDSGLQNPNDICVDDTAFDKINGYVQPRSDSDSVHFMAFAPNKMTLYTRASSNRFLVLQQNNVEDWKVTIDGQKSVWYRANIAYIGIILPAGTHSVEYEFKPRKVLYVVLLTLSFLIICVVVIAYNNRDIFHRGKSAIKKSISRFALARRPPILERPGESVFRNNRQK